MRKNSVLLCVLALLLIQEQGNLQRVSASGFITAGGVQLMLDGTPFYANGFNAYWLMFVASDTSQRNRVSTVFQEAIAHDLKIARTWAFGDGGISPLQYYPGNYNENMFQGLDFVISEAGKSGIKLILSLVNNYENMGGKKQYVEWGRNQGQQISSDDEFFTNSLVKQFYKNHVLKVVTRNNSITGVAYKDDPTIMAWELINEPRCPSDPSGTTLQAWIAEMASYLKSIDQNHLLEVGLEGFYGPYDSPRLPNSPTFQTGTNFITNNQIQGIDFATIHSYPDQWLVGQPDEAQLSFLRDWAQKHIDDAQNILRKPILHAEFGKSSKDPGFDVTKRDQLFGTVYSAILNSASSGGAAAGALFWQLLPEGMDNLGDGYEIIFSQCPSTANIIAQESRELDRIRNVHARTRNDKGNSGN